MNASLTQIDDLAREPEHQINLAEPLSFTFNGRQMQGYCGDTLASALYRNGQRVFSRSFKYHRPRGLLCASGHCPNCIMEVDDIPNLPACKTPLRAGMRARSQNAWPSLKYDILSLADRFHRFLPVGFYYKFFFRPKVMWPLYEKVLRRLAGLGTLDVNNRQPAKYDAQHLHADITVIGGGPAGMMASVEAAGTGASVVLIDDGPQLGGHLRAQTRVYHDLEGYAGLTGQEIARQLSQVVKKMPNIEVLNEASVFGYYPGHQLGIVRSNDTIELQTSQLIVATGAYDRYPVFENNDVPGVMLGHGLQRLVNLYSVPIHERVLIISACDEGLTLAAELVAAKVAVMGVVETRELSVEATPILSVLQSEGIPLYLGYSVLNVRGTRKVEGATLVKVDAEVEPIKGTEQEIACDIVAVMIGLTPANGLLSLAHCELAYDSSLGEFRPSKMAPNVFAAGHVIGERDLKAILAEGQRAGQQAAQCLANSAAREPNSVAPRSKPTAVDVGGKRTQQLRRLVQERTRASNGKCFVCICEDVTVKDLRDSVSEGFRDIQTLKRYSTVSMGPCQGKMCGMVSTEYCAIEIDSDIPETGTTTTRPPTSPISMGALAGHRFEPVQRSPVFYRHVELGATMRPSGHWLRPEYYEGAESEAMVVHQRVGLIDISTLGKIELQGSETVEFLERIYTNRWAGLAINRARYGLMCGEDGSILDDGSCSRLGKQHYFMTTSTSNIGHVEKWLRWWLAIWKLDVQITNVTSAYGTFNLAGPQARVVLQNLTNLDVSQEGLPYMGVIQGEVAGVPALLIRLGFVGELGFEIYFPAAYGEYLWDRLMVAGEESGIVPFGIGAQRLLRLEKGHIIIGQDTDALSEPFGAGLGWAVKLDKVDFLGKAALCQFNERGCGECLVAIEMEDKKDALREGQRILSNEREIAGRVTSAGHSPLLDKTIGLAWVRVDFSTIGTTIQVQIDGRSRPARVVPRPFYDPDGIRLKA